MPKIAYRKKKLGAKAQETIAKANAIIAEYSAAGYELTLRQLYYQFVARDLIPNTQREYKNLGETINDGRLCGLIDWKAIVDRTRNLRVSPSWSSPRQIVEVCARSFAVDPWESQETYVEVWIEKDALVGVIEGVCQRHRVPFFSCRGYTSQSEMWEAAQRLQEQIERGKQEVTVIHLGDHDPSGIDMSRDILDRLQEFGDGAINLERIALNREQVDHYSPPPNPAKTTDARYESYLREHGAESWELDALEPAVIERLVESAISLRVNDEKWAEAMEREREGRSQIARLAKKLDD